MKKHAKNMLNTENENRIRTKKICVFFHPCLDRQSEYITELLHSYIHQDYYRGSIKEFDLPQINLTQNFNLEEPRWDLFKITLSDNEKISTLSKCKSLLYSIFYAVDRITIYQI